VTPHTLQRYFSLEHGWTVASHEVEVSNVITWYVGEPDMAAITVQLVEGVAPPVHAMVTVWFQGVGTSYFVEDTGALARFISLVLPGILMLKDKHLTVIEAPE